MQQNGFYLSHFIPDLSSETLLSFSQGELAQKCLKNEEGKTFFCLRPVCPAARMIQSDKYPKMHWLSPQQVPYDSCNLSETMQVVLEQLQARKCWKSFLKTQCRRNKVSPLLANTFTVVRIKRFFEKMASSEPLSRPRLKSSVWLENELKAYQWFLVVMSGCKGILIQNFGKQQWQELSAIFEKEESILEYEAVKLINQRAGSKRRWEEEESRLLLKIMSDKQLANKWNEIARSLFDTSSKRFFRTGKQCRQQWFNHLDPSKKHGKWESTEDRKIANEVLEGGKKWSIIARSLQGKRTEHMVKNRFKTLTIRLKKKYPQIRGEKELLFKFLAEGGQEDGQEEMEAESESKNEEDGLQVDGLQILQSGREDMDFDDNYQNQNLDKYPPSVRDCQIQQVVTPCPMIYQTFTPTFLNTPNSLAFVVNYSFDHFEKNQNLFLKNN